MTSPTPPPGWYPQTDGRLRYWDGRDWTAHVSGVGPAYPAAGGLVGPAYPAAGGLVGPAYPAAGGLVGPAGPQDAPVAAYQSGGAPAPYAPAPMYAAPPTYAPTYAVAPKSAGVALLASFFLPGLGQFVNGDAGKGVGFLVAYVVGWVSVALLVGIVVVPVVWVWGMVDAYQSAKAWNMRHGILT